MTRLQTSNILLDLSVMTERLMFSTIKELLFAADAMTSVGHDLMDASSFKVISMAAALYRYGNSEGKRSERAKRKAPAPTTAQGANKIQLKNTTEVYKSQIQGH